MTDSGGDKWERLRLIAEMWIGISANFPLPMLIFRNNILVEAIGPIYELTGEPREELLGLDKEKIVRKERMVNTDDSVIGDKGSVVFLHKIVKERVAPASVMHFHYENDIEYEIIMVLAGVRAMKPGIATVRPAKADLYAGI